MSKDALYPALHVIIQFNNAHCNCILKWLHYTYVIFHLNMIDNGERSLADISTVAPRQSEHGHSESSATSNTGRLPLKTPIYL
jgi:hypothetical protein